jgi:hypothetical protein
VNDLLGRHKTLLVVENDMQYDSKTGKCRLFHKTDGTMFSRAQSHGVIRRVKRMRTPCDDQSGDDVCADADGWRGGPR